MSINSTLSAVKKKASTANNSEHKKGTKLKVKNKNLITSVKVGISSLFKNVYKFTVYSRNIQVFLV